MAVDQGMNIAEVEALGVALRNSADDLAGFASALDRLVKSAAWQGAVATKFKSQWWPQHRSRMAQIQTDVRGFGQSAMNNAAEQRTASAATGPSAGGAVVSSDRLAVLSGEATTAGSPAAVRAWWDGMLPAEKDALKAQHPEIIGNLDGVPPEVRYEANRLNIQNHIDALRSHGAPDIEIDRFEAFLTDQRQILLFDPTGDGRIAEVFGNLATADDIAVVVPGVDTSLRSYSPEYALNLLHAAKGDTATIMWLGYDTPPGLSEHDLTDASALSTARATEWAPSLASFTAGLRTSGYGEISIVADSYGTVLAAEAAKVGMTVERVILLGSPGVSADNVGVFNGADVFAAKNTSDYIPPLSTHGRDPTTADFGAKPLPGNPFNLFHPLDHSSYFSRGSNSLDGIITAVEGSRSGADGMIVNRYVNDLGSADDVWTGTY